jgi:hypothetical protein
MLVPSHENDECRNRHQSPPSRDQPRADCRPYDCEENEADTKARVSDQMIEFLVMLDPVSAHLQALVVLL